MTEEEIRGRKTGTKDFLKIYMKTYYCRSFENVYIYERTLNAVAIQ